MSETTPPLEFHWTGAAMVPRRPTLAARYYGAGESVWLEPREPRSMNSHRHYFACIHTAWQNLPDDLAERFATAEHLRKWCLIKAGYRDERTHVCASKAEAQRLAALIRPLDDYAVIVPRGNVLIIWTAKSQSQKAQGRKDFQASKVAVLDEAAKLIGTDPASLRKNAQVAA